MLMVVSDNIFSAFFLFLLLLAPADAETTNTREISNLRMWSCLLCRLSSHFWRLPLWLHRSMANRPPLHRGQLLHQHLLLGLRLHHRGTLQQLQLQQPLVPLQQFRPPSGPLLTLTAITLPLTQPTSKLRSLRSKLNGTNSCPTFHG